MTYKVYSLIEGFWRLMGRALFFAPWRLKYHRDPMIIVPYRNP